MSELTWIFKKFDQLSVSELYAILKVRSEVFVVEQQCIYLDADGKDADCYHLCGWNKDALAAYVRILPPLLAFKEASIGRVLTNPLYRSKGMGKILMEKAIEHTLDIYATSSIRIGAQLYLLQFYTNLGFKQEGEVYMEDGIPHIEMLLTK